MLSQKGGLGVYLLLGVVIVLFLGYLSRSYFPSKNISNPSPSPVSMLTYTNSKYGFSVQYPSSLVVREFPDTKDGAGFRPSGTIDDPVNEVITISVLQKNADLVNDPLSEYAKVAASIQIQNYQKLNTIEALKTSSGAIGYKTTWDVLPMPTLGASPSAETTVSLPITYFDLKEASFSSTAQITLENKDFENQYVQIIDSYTP